MCQIHLLSGPIHSGKTSKLEQWVKRQSSVDGILAPVVNGKRCVKRVSSDEIKLLDIAENQVHTSVVEIGRYRFSGEVFEWAQNQLLDCLKSSINWLVIDEIGPLELQGKGLEPAVSKVISEIPLNSTIKILLVVRDSLKMNVIQHYKLKRQELKIFSLKEL